MKTKKNTKTAAKKTTTTDKPMNSCLCGCRQPCKSTFLQGHDARAKSQLMASFGKDRIKELLSRMTVAECIAHVANRGMKKLTKDSKPAKKTEEKAG